VNVSTRRDPVSTKKIASRAAKTALVAAGGLLVLGAATPASAEVPPPAGENGSDGVITGNAIALDANTPIGVCGIAAALVGNALGGCALSDMPEAPAPAPAASPTVVVPEEGDGVGTGNAIAADLDVPVMLCGISLVGVGNAAGLCH
jgi:hypothetical protein